MYMFISALPVATVIAVLLAGWRSLHAAALGVAVALLVIAAAFAQPASTWLAAGMHWAPVLLEVLLIVGGGLLLSEVLRASGAQKVLADWLLARAGSGTGAVLLVVHGITPFAESVTGFGVGVTIGIPLLAHFGLPPRKVVLIGLLGLCAVPWGSMGPGTLVAATMAGLPFKELGQASALVSVIPFVITGMAAAALASAPDRRWPALLQGLLSGLLLTATVALMNTLAGTAPAGALGALLVVGWHLLRLRVSQADADKPPLSAPGRRHQQQALHAEGAALAGHQQQLDQFVVGAVEAAVQQHLAWYGLAGAERQAQAQLVIGETVPLDGRGGQAQGLGQAQGRGLFVGEIQQQGTHQHSTNNGARLSALPMLKPSARAQAWRANSRSAG